MRDTVEALLDRFRVLPTTPIEDIVPTTTIRKILESEHESNLLNLSLLATSIRQRLLAGELPAGELSESYIPSACKVLVAIYPRSAGDIQTLLKLRNYPWWHEVHFSLFCFMGEHLSISQQHFHPTDRTFISTAISYAAETPLDVEGNRWEAFHVLGSHIPHDFAVQAIVDVFVQSKLVENRLQALRFLEDVLLKSTEELRLKSIRTLNELYKQESNDEIRANIESLCNLLRGENSVREKAPDPEK